MPKTVRVLIEAEFVADNEIAALGVLLGIPNYLRKFIERDAESSVPTGVQRNLVRVKILHRDIF
jgi:hypothetical protein